jgi:hypothetical protein
MAWACRVSGRLVSSSCYAWRKVRGPWVIARRRTPPENGSWTIHVRHRAAREQTHRRSPPFTATPTMAITSSRTPVHLTKFGSNNPMGHSAKWLRR